MIQGESCCHMMWNKLLSEMYWSPGNFPPRKFRIMSGKQLYRRWSTFLHSTDGCNSDNHKNVCAIFSVRLSLNPHCNLSVIDTSSISLVHMLSYSARRRCISDLSCIPVSFHSVQVFVSLAPLLHPLNAATLTSKRRCVVPSPHGG